MRPLAAPQSAVDFGAGRARAALARPAGHSPDGAPMVAVPDTDAGAALPAAEPTGAPPRATVPGAPAAGGELDVEGGAVPVDKVAPGAETGFLAEMNPALRSNLARASVLALTIVWATNFPVIKAIFDTGLTAPNYAALRFTLAAAALLPLARWDNRELLWGSAQCGACVAMGYMTQAIALTTASANKGAFICASQVIFVALVNAIGTRTFVPRTWAAAVLALAGVGLLELAGPVRPELSDLWCLGMPVFFGAGYIRLEELMSKYPTDARTVSALKVAVVGLTAIGWSAGRALTDPAAPTLLDALTAPHLPWVSLLYTGLVTTAGAILVESYAFKYVPATDAAIILATEPLWAALFAAHMLGETLSPTDIAGGTLVISACVVNELRFGGPAGKHDKGTGESALNSKGD
ncbi:hypothetical protein KFE25_008096 [Diacronema lutheri]|uniref:EamA domain-containing protein n=2 Tax=Diacronema lutheri TaxID=2081491 RepID=A0A8J6C9N9_DIALT|nr:hypothetical protein KFE25_008096 [Diacronema lutheri]